VSCRETVAPQWRDRLAANGLPELGRLLDDVDPPRHLAGRWKPLAKPGLGGRQRWRWTLPQEYSSTPLYVKRYAATPLRQQWDRLCRQTARHSRACWEFRQSERLTAAHLNVPRAVGFAEQMIGVLERCSVVLLEQAPGDALDRAWARLCEQNAPATRGLARHDLVVRLARFVAAFHGTGFCHRDLYLCHVFVDLVPNGTRPPRFTLIDLARTYRPRWRRVRWIIKDLAQLDASARQVGATRSDRWRFLLTYLNLQRGAARARWYARRIVHKSDWILRRIARKGR
jgi:heptose I phosphotransferase